MVASTILKTIPLRRLILAGLLLPLSAGRALAADEPQPMEAEEDLPRLPAALHETSAWSWLESSRDSVSRNVTNVGRRLDDWLAGDSVGDRSNESYLRLRLNQQLSETGAYYSNVGVSGRIDLPQATAGWELIFESDDLDRGSLPR